MIMPIHVIREDITKIKCDAIVNPTNNHLDGSGSIDAKIHKLAGHELKEECRKIGYCKTGEAVLTRGYQLLSKYVIHTVGPIWIDGLHNEAALLESCYRNCLEIAKAKKCKSMAFPIISSGTFKFPKEEAFRIAVQTINQFMDSYEMDVYLVVFNKEITYISKQLFKDVKEYIDDHYEAEEAYYSRRNHIPFEKCISFESSIHNLDDLLDISFSEELIRLIDSKGMKDSDCYKKANIDRKLFNKIKNNPDYHPKKETVICFALALELNMKQTQDLLSKAGYTLSNSYKFDVIIQYFINKKIYDIMLINETLYSFDQKLL